MEKNPPSLPNKHVYTTTESEQEAKGSFNISTLFLNLHKVLYLNSSSNQGYCGADKRFLSPDRRPLKTRTQPRHVFLSIESHQTVNVEREKKKVPACVLLREGLRGRINIIKRRYICSANRRRFPAQPPARVRHSLPQAIPPRSSGRLIG